MIATLIYDYNIINECWIKLDATELYYRHNLTCGDPIGYSEIYKR